MFIFNRLISIYPQHFFSKKKGLTLLNSSSHPIHTNMKNLDINMLEPDPIASALANSDKELVVITGFVCSKDESSVSISENRMADTYTIYPRSAIVSAFSPEKKGCGNDEDFSKVTLLVHANTRTKTISNSTTGTSYQEQGQALRMRNNNSGGCGTKCKSADGWSECCCPVGQRCRSLSGTCKCEDATNAGPAFDGSIFPSFYDNDSNDLTNNYPDYPPVTTGANMKVPGGPSTVPQGYRRVCIRSPYVVCDLNGCRTEYGWVCYYYPIRKT